MQGIVLSSRSVEAVAVFRRIDSVYTQNSKILPHERSKVALPPPKSLQVTPATWFKIPTNRRPPNAPAAWTSQELSKPCSGDLAAQALIAMLWSHTELIRYVWSEGCEARL